MSQLSRANLAVFGVAAQRAAYGSRRLDEPLALEAEHQPRRAHQSAAAPYSRLAISGAFSAATLFSRLFTSPGS